MSRLQDAILAAGLLAARPAFGSEGRLYFATDNATLYRDTGVAWETYAGGGTHDILSATHSDADPQAVTRGSIIYGDATPEWSELVIGAAMEVLTVNAGATEPEWAVASGGSWALIAETVLGAPAASVNFAAIPGIYRMLMLFMTVRSAVAGEVDGLRWRVNADAAGNYEQISLSGTASNARVSTGGRAQTSGRCGQCDGNNSRANCFSPSQLLIQNYALTDREKYGHSAISSIIGNVGSDADLKVIVSGGHWRNTAAITSLLIFLSTASNFMTLSRFALYGIT